MKKKNYKKINIGKKYKISCLIPIRSNSKRIKNKNFTKIKNVPLIKFVLQNICKSKYIDDYFIATDNLHKVSKIIKKNNKIRFFLRSKKSSSAIAQTEVVISEFIKQKNVDIVVLVQATNPFIKNIYLDQALEILINQKLDSLLSVVKAKILFGKIVNIQVQ